MKITLNAADIAAADAVATKRNSENRRVGRKDGKVLKNSIDIDIQGARSEQAVAKGLNMQWDGSFLPDDVWKIWRNVGHDVQQLEVRSTRHPNGRLILHPDDCDDSPFILVLAHNDPEFEIVGWFLGKDGKRKEWWVDVGYGRPCYYVPRDQMRSMDDLHLILTEANHN